MAGDGLVEVFRRVLLGNQGHRLGPGQGGLLALGEEGGLAPGGEAIEPLLRFAQGAGFLAVLAEAVGAAVDLETRSSTSAFSFGSNFSVCRYFPTVARAMMPSRAAAP